ncbi:MAG TPA: TIGR02206 family membrane protein [Rhizomicrobium sp.]|nr:TIGR02206 family membrane protein [Rhizomicrobium sp.]
MSTPFVLLGPAHIAAVALTLAVPLSLAALTRRSAAMEPVVRSGFALLLLGGYAAWYAMFALRGWLGLGNALPFNLCDWAAIALVITLFWPNQFTYDLGYFWGLAGTMHGLLTPPVHHEFPDPEFIFFFVNHGGIIASILFLTVGSGLRPLPRSVPRAIIASLIYAAVAGTVDWLLGVNYGLLRAKPDNVSVLDLLSPWPWYIPQLIAIGIASVLLYYLPFFLYDLFSARRKGAPA